MLCEGIRPIGDGLLEITQEFLDGLLSQDDINDVYDVEQTPFARGKFAAVRRAVNKKTGVHFAAKFLRRRRRAQCSDKEIGHEIAVLSLCSDSEYIVKLHGVHETKTETALLLELATGGELQAILDEDEKLNETQTRICMQQVLKALQYLHKKYIAHLDLKPQNILLTGTKVEDGLKLCDFGISRIVQEGGKVREILGTPDYVAPEVLQYEPLSLQTDIWSVGVLTYVLLTGCSPFGGDTKQETFSNITQCDLTFPDELFEDVSPLAIDFIKSTLRIKPTDRLDAFECLQHRWLREESPVRTLKCSPNSYTVATMKPECFTIKRSTPSIDNSGSDNNQIKITATIKLSNGINSNYRKVEIEMADQQTTSPSATPTHCDSTVNGINHNKENILGIDCNLRTTLKTSHCDTMSSEPKSAAVMKLFPDAPTTPKVSRKAPPESPPSVKELVKKFQIESSTTNGCNPISPSNTTIVTSPVVEVNGDKSTYLAAHRRAIETSTNDYDTTDDPYNSTTSLCKVSTRCLSSGNDCQHLNTSPHKQIGGMDHGIIC